MTPAGVAFPLMSTASAESSDLCCILAFNRGNQLAVRHGGGENGLAFTGGDLALATARLESAFPRHTAPTEYFSVAIQGRSHRVFFVQVDTTPADGGIAFHSIDDLSAPAGNTAPELAGILAKLGPYLIEIP